MAGRYHVSFVCSGNICRSPIAEKVFAHEVEQAGLLAADLLIALDAGHLRALRRIAPDPGRVQLLRAFDPDAPPGAGVPDPYYGGAEGFTEVLTMIRAATPGLLEYVKAQL
jgi:protein-tyrosine phosphatase